MAENRKPTRPTSIMKKDMEDPGPVVDQGNQQTRLCQSDLEGEIAGHRAVFVGVHVPLKTKNRHKHKHRNKKKRGNGEDHEDGNGITIQIGGGTPPTQHRAGNNI
ncbi:sodium bicarbonate cotransporter 3-like isoform X2 [Anneissia japonica]|uniref:sodium bicarbonate cotransporter 3-like isoform X2 n=1 Tax=Anneissia japonica TaxID=1529436 RepID=UPI0014255C2F|nr:sodium bicarbonate cotransporter 3-like isoform X2 [Anneissia japonica]